MSMTLEEAIVQIESLKDYCEYMAESDESGAHVFDLDEQALDLALAALRGPTREMVERMRGEWIWHGEEVHCAAGNFQIRKCKQCKKEMLLDDYDNFCPACGAPMTDEAVDVVMERIKALHNA